MICPAPRAEEKQEVVSLSECACVGARYANLTNPKLPRPSPYVFSSFGKCHPPLQYKDRWGIDVHTQMIIILSDIGHSGAEQEVRRDWVQAVGRASPQRSNFAASFQMFLPIVAVSAMLLKPRMITCRCTLLHPVHEMHRRSPVDDALVQRQ